ncbi:helix-turn-helix domain-containing protein [Aneurinibacillus migulanus]
MYNKAYRFRLYPNVAQKTQFSYIGRQKLKFSSGNKKDFSSLSF